MTFNLTRHIAHSGVRAGTLAQRVIAPEIAAAPTAKREAAMPHYLALQGRTLASKRVLDWGSS
ncbi:MAG: hypothetical protein AAFY19_00760 [Pseudomonadota bacterium]